MGFNDLPISESEYTTRGGTSAKISRSISPSSSNALKLSVNTFLLIAGMSIPSELIPYCPKCGKPMTVNLRSDDKFVQDGGWNTACKRYENFLSAHKDGRLLLLELGVGMNTPIIIKYPFWRLTMQNKKATYACINYGEAVCPKEIEKQSVCINADIKYVLDAIF